MYGATGLPLQMAVFHHQSCGGLLELCNCVQCNCAQCSFLSLARSDQPRLMLQNQELTLAQRYGLCPRPASRLGEVQWRRVSAFKQHALPADPIRSGGHSASSGLGGGRTLQQYVQSVSAIVLQNRFEQSLGWTLLPSELMTVPYPPCRSS